MKQDENKVRNHQKNTQNIYNNSIKHISSGQKRTILVVDDVFINRSILSKILKNDGFDTIEADNGKVAFDMLSDPKYNISLVLLDIIMPVMNGYEFLERMKQTGKLSSVPVIVTTVSEQNNAEIRSLECGATDFITKPYNPDIVCHRVRSILRLFDNAVLLNSLQKDRLTGVYNREFFYRSVEAKLAENPDEKYDIICSNIENFKVINSKYGVTVGDELLRYIADNNKLCVGPDGVCGRIGADCFAALRKRQAVHTQDEIGEKYADAYADAPVKNFVMKYGLYQIEDRTVSVPSMCDLAQIALSSIKYKYGVYYAIYDESMKQKALREHQLSEYMEQALAKREFVVYLQPKHSIETGCVAGAEALVRWIHPELGFISPGEFIPLFERNGFITKLDHYIWEEACSILHRWMGEGRTLIPVSVNASRADFAEDDLPEKIGEMVDSYNIPHQLIHFEVTESAYTENPQQIIKAVSTLREMGFLIEMDDFGSGYSSLNMLSELPIDYLKLDMKFMKVEKGSDPDSKHSILNFIISLSKWLQLPTIAEGVESKEEVKLLKTMGCNFIQGYYYAKPMSVNDFEKYMIDYAQTHPFKCNKKKSLQTGADYLSDEDKPLVLIVEDIDSNRALLKEILSPYYKIQSAANGKEAYHFIQINHEDIACMMLDLLMPVMDGFQLLDLMRNDGSLDEIPVIITSETGTDCELRALRLGADSFVGKPYNPEILLHHTKKAIHERDFRKMLIQAERESAC